MHPFQIISRRRFLGQNAKIGLGVALSTLLDIPLVMKRALASGIGQPGPDGKIKKVLFIWLRGANDGLNAVIPIRDSAYVNLLTGTSSIRPTLRIQPQIKPGTASEPIAYDYVGPAFDPTQFQYVDDSAGSPLRAATDATFSYDKAIRLGNGFAALHPSLKFLSPVYNAGDLALVHRVAYPKQSQSHFDSQRYWENGTPNNNLVNDGIFYRAILESGLANTRPLTGISIQSSLPLILRGSQAAMTNLSDPTRYDLLGIPAPAGDAKATNALYTASGFPFPQKKSRDLLNLQYENLTKTLGEFAAMDFTETGNTYQDDIKTDGDTAWVPINSTGTSIGDSSKGYFLFPTSSDKNGGWRRPDTSVLGTKYVVDPGQQSFFNNLKAAALVLNHTDAIIAGTEMNGFDTHNNQGALTGQQPNLLRTIGWSLYALRKYFQNHADRATWENVVVVTLSEFGRTTVENSTVGTDHGLANVMFVAGGPVLGYGKPGSLNGSGVYNCGTSDLIPWVTGNSGAMFASSSRYLKRTTDYRSVLGEIVRKHLGASDPQMRSVIPGYQSEPELAGQRTVASSSIDGAPVTGEIGIL